MKSEDHKLFNLLKQVVASTFLANYNASSNIEEWKGEDIVNFQEDLLNKVKTSISEKWFYTYIKNEADKLPRVDMLNLLSNYSGYQNWSNFKKVNQTSIDKQKNKVALIKYYWLVLIPIITIIAFNVINKKNSFEFCFIDEIKNETIHSYLNVQILKESESPIFFKTDSSGCFKYTTKDDIVQFIVQSPYYKTDTIVRSITHNTNNIIKLHTDDYALMLYYYSNGKIKDWKERKLQLENLIADDALIYQVYSNTIGVEMYTKSELINKLTTPTSSLKNISILERSYKNGKIVKLKFIVK